MSQRLRSILVVLVVLAGVGLVAWIRSGGQAGTGETTRLGPGSQDSTLAPEASAGNPGESSSAAGTPPAAREQAGDVADTQPAAGPLPRMVDLGAHQCIPCQMMAPILKELQSEYASRAQIQFIDVRQNPAAGRWYGIRAIPTQIFYDRAGKEVWRHEGFLSKEAIVARLKELGA